MRGSAAAPGPARLRHPGDTRPTGRRTPRSGDGRLRGDGAPAVRDGGCRDGDGEEERAAPAGSALEPDPAVLELDQLLGDGQAQPGAAELAGRAGILLAEL